MSTLHEAARDLPLRQPVDVIVCGGGPAGVAAAIAAGRAGASVRLIEVAGCIGGIWTNGLLAWILDQANKPGLLREIIRRLEACPVGLACEQNSARCADVEALKLLLEAMCTEAGVKIRLHSRVAAVHRDGRRLAAVITESKSGREAFPASVFVDCTGDGDVAAQAGCRFDLGRPGSGQTQPFSLIGIVGGIRLNRVGEYIHTRALGFPHRHGTRKLLERLATQGVEPSYNGLILMRVCDDLFLLMANHEYGGSAIDADDVTAKTLAARIEVNHIVDALRASGDGFEQVRLIATANQIGTREGRRVRGLYEVTTADLVGGTRFDDAVCRVTFGVDVHNTDPGQGKGIEQTGIRSKPYDIPLRSLIAVDAENLLMAGRCISGDFIAHSSYRVTGNAVAMGQAAGLCAALAARTGVAPRTVPFADLLAESRRLNLEMVASD